MTWYLFLYKLYVQLVDQDKQLLKNSRKKKDMAVFYVKSKLPYGFRAASGLHILDFRCAISQLNTYFRFKNAHLLIKIVAFWSILSRLSINLWV